MTNSLFSNKLFHNARKLQLPVSPLFQGAKTPHFSWSTVRNPPCCCSFKQPAPHLRSGQDTSSPRENVRPASAKTACGTSWRIPTPAWGRRRRLSRILRSLDGRGPRGGHELEPGSSQRFSMFLDPMTVMVLVCQSCVYFELTPEDTRINIIMK